MHNVSEYVEMYPPLGALLGALLGAPLGMPPPEEGGRGVGNLPADSPDHIPHKATTAYHADVIYKE